jgi:hypothetical protein
LAKWELEGKAVRGIDFDAKTGTYNVQLEFDPSLASEMNKYKVKK